MKNVLKVLAVALLSVTLFAVVGCGGADKVAGTYKGGSNEVSTSTLIVNEDNTCIYQPTHGKKESQKSNQGEWHKDGDTYVFEVKGFNRFGVFYGTLSSNGILLSDEQSGDDADFFVKQA